MIRMPYIWLDSDELQALQDAYDWRNRIGRPMDWQAYERAKTHILEAAASVQGDRRAIVPVRRRLHRKALRSD